MDTRIVVVFCLCDDMLKALHHKEDVQCQMSDAEVITTAIVAMLYFKGNFCMASRFLFDGNYIPKMLVKLGNNSTRIQHTWLTVTQLRCVTIIASVDPKFIKAKTGVATLQAKNDISMAFASIFWSRNMVNQLSFSWYLERSVIPEPWDFTSLTYQRIPG